MVGKTGKRVEAKRLGGEITAGEIESEKKDEFKGFPSKLVSSDDLERLHIPWIRIEALPKTIKNDAYVMNLRNQHWIAIVIQFPEIYIFDPLSTKVNTQDIPTHHKELINWAKNLGFNKIYANDIKVQPKFSNLCGHFCIYFVKHIKALNGRLNEQVFDNFINTNFRDGDDVYNTKKVIAFSNKIGLT